MREDGMMAVLTIHGVGVEDFHELQNRVSLGKFAGGRSGHDVGGLWGTTRIDGFFHNFIDADSTSAWQRSWWTAAGEWGDDPALRGGHDRGWIAGYCDADADGFIR
jgi:hypothetical protein